MFELDLSQMAETKSKPRNRFSFFRIMTSIQRISNWSYEFRNLFLKCREIHSIKRLGSNFFHSRIVDGKKKFLKKIILPKNPSGV